MKKVKITIEGIDLPTEFEMKINKNEEAFLKKLQKKSEECAISHIQPIIEYKEVK